VARWSSLSRGGRTCSRRERLRGFLVAQQAVRRRLPKGFGAILFTGASASVKVTLSQQRSRWASSLFVDLRRAWRANSRAGHSRRAFVIDGAIRNPAERDAGQARLDARPDALQRPISSLRHHAARGRGIELRPWWRSSDRGRRDLPRVPVGELLVRFRSHPGISRTNRRYPRSRRHPGLAHAGIALFDTVFDRPRTPAGHHDCFL